MAKTSAAYQAILAESKRLGLPKGFQKDVTEHDRNFMGAHEGSDFLWAIGENGTFCSLFPSFKIGEGRKAKRIADGIHDEYPHMYLVGSGGKLRKIGADEWFALSLEGSEDMRSNGRATVADEDAARELVLFTENDAKLWGPGNTQGASIRENIARKLKSGKLDVSKLPKLFEYLMDSAAKAYEKDYGGHNLFNAATRRLAAKDFAEQYVDELKATGLLTRNGAPQVITVSANVWRDLNGNTYHVAYVTAHLPGGRAERLKSPVTYGGSSGMYLETAREMLVEAGIIPTSSKAHTWLRAIDVEDLGATRVSRKKDL